MPSKPTVVAQLEELPPGGMKGVKLGETDVLLARIGDAVHAVEGACPHAGAPLAEGVLVGDRVVCPWHKAEFCVVTGACTEPPAVDDLKRYVVSVDDGRISISPESAASAAPPGSDRHSDRVFAILGAGGGGTSAAQTLREAGFDGRVVMIDRDTALPYDRTLLSKYALSGETGGEKTPLHDGAFYRDNRIERVRGEVTELDAASRSITLADGTVIGYDAALIATGGSPVKPPFPGGDLDKVFLLRSRADAGAIVKAAKPKGRAVVVGSGFIGMEAAASLRERGLHVTVVGQDKIPFEKQLGSEIGQAFRQLHEEKGVKFRLGEEVAALEGDAAVERVRLKSGVTIKADLVVIGLGIEPATDFIRNAPIERDGALAVDAALRLADGLFAAGDVALFPLRGDGKPIRVEHWRVAMQQGRLAARNMLGQGLPYASIPYFWTIHFNERLDYVGHAAPDDEIVLRGEAASRDFIAYYLREGLVTAAAGMGRDLDMAAVLALMDRQRAWRLDDLHPADASPSAVLARQ